MRAEDVKIGMKVVPHDHSAWGKTWKEFLQCETGKAFLKKGFMTVAGNQGKDDWILDSHGAFRASDFEPYVEHNRNTFGGRIDGNTITVHIGKATGTAKYNPADAKHGMPFRLEIGLAIAYMRAEGKTEDEVDIFTERLIHAHAKEQIAKATASNPEDFKVGDLVTASSNALWLAHYVARIKSITKPRKYVLEMVRNIDEDDQWRDDTWFYSFQLKHWEELSPTIGNHHSVTIDGVRYVPETEAPK